MKSAHVMPAAFALLVGTSFSASVAAQSPPNEAATPKADTAHSTSRTPSTRTNAGDSLALGLLGAVNQHEIAAARQAKQKNVSKPVADYAEMMETEHGENQAKTKALGTLASTSEVAAKKAQGRSELDTLAKKNGKDYEAAYIDAMVKGHTEALALIDDKLLPTASSSAVKAHLSDTRTHVAHHLQAAKQLQATPSPD